MLFPSAKDIFRLPNIFFCGSYIFNLIYSCIFYHFYSQIQDNERAQLRGGSYDNWSDVLSGNRICAVPSGLLLEPVS
jgi:hypothetical protein